MIHREASHFPARGNLQQGRERACQSHMQLVAPGEKGIPSPPGKSRLLQGTEVGAGEESLRNVRGFQWGVIGICCPRPCWGDGGWYPKYNKYLNIYTRVRSPYESSASTGKIYRRRVEEWANFLYSENIP